MKTNTTVTFLKDVTLSADDRKLFNTIGSNWLEVNKFLVLGKEEVNENNIKKLFALELEQDEPRQHIIDKLYPRLTKLRRLREEQELHEFVINKIRRAGIETRTAL